MCVCGKRGMGGGVGGGGGLDRENRVGVLEHIDPCSFRNNVTLPVL